MRRNWPREGRQPVRDAGGFGPREGGQIRPNSERRNCPVRDAIYALGIGPVRGATLTGPTLRANLASRIAGRFARTNAKILALTREGRFSAKVAYYAEA